MKCQYCQKLILLEYYSHEGKSYHASCFEDFIRPKCSICNKGISNGYYKDDWGNIICSLHKSTCCSSCNRFVDTKAITVNGRCYCSGCSAIAVNRSIQIPQIYSKIITVYNRYGILNVPTNLPISIVDVYKIKDLTKSNTSITGLARTSSIGFGKCKKYFHEIYILGGMPLLEFESTLAHELLHTWLNQYDINMSDPATEGFCNLGSYLMLSLVKSKHNEIVMKNMLANPNPVYGEGFRKMLKQVQIKGWRKFTEDVKLGKII